MRSTCCQGDSGSFGVSKEFQETLQGSSIRFQELFRVLQGVSGVFQRYSGSVPRSFNWFRGFQVI